MELKFEMEKVVPNYDHHLNTVMLEFISEENHILSECMYTNGDPVLEFYVVNQLGYDIY